MITETNNTSKIKNYFKDIDNYGIFAVGVTSAILYYIVENIINLNEDLTVKLTIVTLLLFSTYSQYLINKVKDSRKEATRNEHKYRMLAENVSDVVWVLDLDLHYVYLSSSVEYVLGYNVNSLLIKPIDAILTPDSSSKVRKEIKQKLNEASGKVMHTPSTFEYQVYNIHGEQIWMEAKLNIIYDEHHTPSGVQCVSRDITERKESEARILQTQALLEKQLRRAQQLETIGILTSGIAHDFNNLLASITSTAELVMDSIPEDTPEHDDMKRILKVSMRGKALVRRILSFTGKRSEEHRAFDVVEETKEAIQLLKSTLPSSININIQVDPDTGYMQGDPVQLQQVIMNLATNSIHALQDIADPTLLILLRPLTTSELSRYGINDPSQEYVMLEVTDNGCGIEEEDQDKIFEPFYTRKGFKEGSGLGLAVVKGVVKAHKGHITLKSEVGKGTTFRIFFPKASSKNVDIRGAGPEELGSASGEVILFADDDLDVLESIGRVLNGMGYFVLPAPDGQKALDLFNEHSQRIDLVIADQEMPFINGVDLSKKVFAIRPDTKYILLTGAIDEAKTLIKKSPKIHEVIFKPIERDYLAACIRRVLSDQQCTL